MHQRNARFAVAVLALGLLIALPAGTTAQNDSGATTWDVTQARGVTRDIDFTTTEGTWMSVDLAPDGSWIAFDLLGHVYRMPAGGGAAQSLTQTSGVAVNYHPAISPDGQRVAFISDREGQNNLWVMDADGSNPRAVFEDENVRASAPAWSPDGNYIYVRRQSVGPGGGGGGGSGIWMYHRDGGRGVEVVGGGGVDWPSPSADGRYLFYHESTGGGFPGDYRDALQGRTQLRRMDMVTGDVIEITSGSAAQQLRTSSGGAYAPEVSPDGRWLTFARRIPHGRIEFKGHEFGPRTALWIRDLQSGAERVVMDPIETDMAETFKVTRLLPDYTWSADGSSIVISQGGKIRRLNVSTGAVSTIPFEARVQRTISEQAYQPFRIPDTPFHVKFTRWQTGAPNGGTLAFQAVGRIWRQNMSGGTPQRATPDGFAPFEFAPAWSPNGQWIAFTTWQDTLGGHLWRVRASGGQPEQLTRTPGEYVNPAWSPDGRAIVVARGAGASFRNRSMVQNPHYDLVTVPAAGGEAQFITTVGLPEGMSFFAVSRSQIVRPTWSSDGRIYFQKLVERNDDNVGALASVRLDGSDLRLHMTMPFADEIMPSPNRDYVAFNEGDNVYVVPLPVGTGSDPVHIEKKRGALPVETLSTEGGLYPRWRDASTVEFGSGPTYYAYSVAAETTDTVAIDLRIPRDRPQQTVALTGARIVTLEDDAGVIENGTLVVSGGRIRCVGQCSTSDADSVIDARGATIIPGFIDMHAHFYREFRGIIPRRPYETAVGLAYGVTTALDNSMWSQDVFPTGELIEAGEIIGPRTFSTGDPLYSGDRGRQNELTSREITEQNVKRLKSWGAVSLKQYLQPKRNQRQWVSDVARAQGLMVTAEGSDLAYNLGMIMDGQTGWEHPMSYAGTYADVARFFGAAEAVYSVTFMVGGSGPWNEEYYFQQDDVGQNAKYMLWMPWRQVLPHSRRRMTRPKSDYSFPLLAQSLADIIGEGGYGAIGAHGQQHGIASHWEVWSIAEAMGPLGALEVASKHGAYFLGALEDVGTIAVGKLADVIVLNSNPLDDIQNTLDMRWVMKEGRLYDATTLDEIWPRTRPYGPRPWVNPDALRNDVRGVNYWERQQQ